MSIRYQFLIKNGTVVDGTGAPAFIADVRVDDGIITKIGKDLAIEGRERVIDATGCYVTPGFIESHNHWDAGVWWSPMVEPMASYGITSSINGNCGFSCAPLSQDPAVRNEMINIFNYFEDIPVKAQQDQIPWKWTKWSEYRDSLSKNVKFPVNFGALCGHIPIRLTVMGLDAWDREANSAEIAAMAELLEDALQAGAIGMSSNLMDRDRQNRPIPTKLANDEEWLALLKVLARYPGAMLQVMVDTVRDLNGAEQLAHLGELNREAGARIQWSGMPTLKFQKEIKPRFQEVHDRLNGEGQEVWTTYSHVAPTVVFNMDAGMMFGQQGAPVWQAFTNEPERAKKEAMLTDPAWLDQARKSWDGLYSHSTLLDPTSLTFIESQTGYGPTGITLADHMKAKGFDHPSDAFADWLLYNGSGSVIHKRAWEFDDDVIMELFHDPRGCGNASDGGAHGQTLCGAGDNIYLLTHFVRDQKLLSIEEGIHVMTGKLAECFALADRGILKEGLRADIAVFNIDEVERRPQEKIWDVPDGEGGRTYRYTRAAAPMRITLCNGVATFDNGTVTGRFPGELIAPSAQPPFALAAE
ncbi:N-acyl-D-amino-acid deacylase family protein [Sphingobium tyrosinilyticum]|uniref:Amidohydrolase family protein n=1 Tax=Sphingobium tyrosinilyticum TaxID=2715436 RepID=A0ABV9F2M6_9SPHN